MTLREQIRGKFEEFEFDSDKVIDWIFEQTKDRNRRLKAFWILTEFPEYGEPAILQAQREKKKNGR